MLVFSVILATRIFMRGGVPQGFASAGIDMALLRQRRKYSRDSVISKRGRIGRDTRNC